MASSGDPNQNLHNVQRQTEQVYLDWKAQRDALRADYDNEQRRNHDEYMRAKADIEKTFQEEREAAASGGPKSLQMMEEIFRERRDNKIKVLDRDSQQQHDKLKAAFDTRMAAHSTKFSEMALSVLAQPPPPNIVVS